MKNGKTSFYTVEEGIPRPTRESRWYGEPPRRVYPWSDMQVDDSFLAPLSKKPAGLMNAARAFARRRNLDWTFEVHAVEGGLRVWRTK